eukprot:GHVU01048577.1.p1 GENE.GHVU01048577.1~~GHVU01048577.1.p1  ORF type:complete len:101 (+),score=13.87 GHVU01048577.1:370-672(+)
MSKPITRSLSCMHHAHIHTKRLISISHSLTTINRSMGEVKKIRVEPLCERASGQRADNYANDDKLATIENGEENTFKFTTNKTFEKRRQTSTNMSRREPS